MRPNLSGEIIEFLLTSMQQAVGEDTLMTQFACGPPGSALWNRRIGITVFFRHKELLRAALLLRNDGPIYLKYTAMSVVENYLRHFVTEYFWIMLDETFGKTFSDSYANNVSGVTKQRLADALASSAIFHPACDLTLFPLVPFEILSDFDSPLFFLVQPKSLDKTKLPNWDMRAISSTSFPPLTDWQNPKILTGAWLGVRSPSLQVSMKMRSAILGALALTVQTVYLYQFTGRVIFGGRCTFTDTGTQVTDGEPHTPRLGINVVISGEDKKWLEILAQKLASEEKSVRRQMRALEYFYRAWPLDPSERFPFLCMTLEAVFGGGPRPSSNATDTDVIVYGVIETVGSHVEEKRVRHLMKLRGDVIHGRAPDVYDATNYNSYYSEYGDDPIHDLELLTAACLRSRIFGDLLNEHADPYAKEVSNARDRGIISKVPHATILTKGS